MILTIATAHKVVPATMDPAKTVVRNFVQQRDCFLRTFRRDLKNIFPS
jgi:hypothetical protein